MLPAERQKQQRSFTTFPSGVVVQTTAQSVTSAVWRCYFTYMFDLPAAEDRWELEANPLTGKIQDQRIRANHLDVG
jgi:hypothetical protein